MEGRFGYVMFATHLPDVTMCGGDSGINELDVEGRGLGWGYKFGIH